MKTFELFKAVFENFHLSRFAMFAEKNVFQFKLKRKRFAVVNLRNEIETRICIKNSTPQTFNINKTTIVLSI